jgi:hypothetical protein
MGIATNGDGGAVAVNARLRATRIASAAALTVNRTRCRARRPRTSGGDTSGSDSISDLIPAAAGGAADGAGAGAGAGSSIDASRTVAIKRYPRLGTVWMYRGSFASSSSASRSSATVVVRRESLTNRPDQTLSNSSCFDSTTPGRLARARSTSIT